MKTPAKIVLLCVATLAVAAGTVHLFLPGGLPAAVEKALASSASKERSTPSAPARTDESSTPAAGGNELIAAERAFDAGEFSKAVDGFLAARADADADYRARAESGLKKAMLAWALTVNPAPPKELPADVDAEIARRQKEVEATPSEQAWYDLTMFAAGVGAKYKLKTFTRQAIDAALRDGPVETRLRKVLERSGPRAALLKEAMLAGGFLDAEPVDPVAAATKPRPEQGKKPAPFTPGKASITTPVGRFKPETKAKLDQAVDLEKKGALEYDLSGPDNAQRKQHRKAALDYLKEARDIYQAAEDEDENSPSLNARLREVMEMISHLNKESSLGD